MSKVANANENPKWDQTIKENVPPEEEKKYFCKLIKNN